MSASNHTETTHRSDWLDDDYSHLWHPYTARAEYRKQAMLIVRAQGSIVWDVEGHSYLDGISGLWNVNLGHNRPEIKNAITSQLGELDYFPLNGFSHDPAIKLAKGLAEIAPKGLTKVFFTPGGGEATDTAIKMSRRYWSLVGQATRSNIVSLEGAYHGSTFGALSAAGIQDERSGYEPLLNGFHQAPGLLAAEPMKALKGYVERLGPETVAAIILEPVQGVAGILVPPAGYLRAVRRLANEIGCHLIVDEIATGFGRTGKIFASNHDDVVPDFLLVAKAMTNGTAPLGAVLTTDEICSAHSNRSGLEGIFMHGFTFGGHPIACAAGLATLAIHRSENPSELANQKGKRLLGILKGELILRSHIVKGVRGIGLMIGLEFANTQRTGAKQFAEAVARKCKDRGLIVRSIGGVIPIMPPLTISQDELGRLAATLITSVGLVEDVSS
jgi:adenosylmethionine-8-amino-7-oxononanoate aminotransferase